ncbi:hypothetical protein ACQKM9_17255 [Viridibacillus sp. NPDC093762]|uniref:hypothetical protein n=1 Tax=Viridibacillus sp. NPDC093762 TaxID=3390720 RepID=UPI003CFFD2C6
MDKLMIGVTSYYICLILANGLRNNWTLETLIKASTFSKFILVMLLITVTYLNIIYIRAESNIKKKRGNQRIQVEPNNGKNLFKTLSQYNKEREYEKNNIVIILGKKTNNGD